MLVRLIPLAAVLLVLEPGPVSAAPEDKQKDDPNATYTIKIREAKAGDKALHTEVETGTSEITFGGMVQKQKDEKKLEYTEHIIDIAKDAPKPTKLTREYKVAQQLDRKAGEVKPLPYEGKTVAIEKKGTAYQFLIGDKQADPKDVPDLAREFAKQNKDKIEDMLPKKAVKVGESWTIDKDALKSLVADANFPLDATKSKMTGKLTKAYQKDGKQWGVIALDMDLVLDSAAAKAKGESSGTIKIAGTLDVVIDGSTRDGTMKMNMKFDVSTKETGAEIKITADMNMTKTITTVK